MDNHKDESTHANFQLADLTVLLHLHTDGTECLHYEAIGEPRETEHNGVEEAVGLLRVDMVDCILGHVIKI